MLKTLVSTILALSSVAGNAQTPLDQRSFTDDMILRIKAAYPNAKIRSKKPLDVEVRDKARGIDSTLWLDRIYNLCANQSPVCDSERERTILLLAEATEAAHKSTAKDTAALRVIVRPRDALDATEASFSTGTIYRSLADGLILVLAVDHPNTLAWVTAKDYPGGEAKHNELIAIGRANTAKELATDMALRSIAVDGFTLVAGNAYDSSCMADHEKWANLAKVAKGRFVVSIPGADSCLFGDITSDGQLAQFRTVTTNIMKGAQRAISEQVYQWTPGGWAKVE